MHIRSGLTGRGWARAGIGLLIVLGVSACAQTVDLTPVNQQAADIGRPKMHLLSILPGSAANVVMPNGENVTGWLSIDVNAPGTGPDGNATLIATGPRTKLVCHGLFVAGHGKLTCRSPEGAAYEVQL